MKSIFKIIHLLSVSIFIGSIATYVFFGALVPNNNEVAMMLNREWVSTSTTYLTIVAMWVAGISGILMSGKPKSRWLWVKLVGFVMVALNTHLFISPAITTSLEALGNNDDLFKTATLQEAIFGAINLLMLIALVSVAVVKPKLSRAK